METSKELESAINAVALCTKAYEAYMEIAVYIVAIEVSVDRAKAYVENCTVQQRPQAEKILESWELVLAEMRHRLEQAKRNIEAAVEEVRKLEGVKS